MEAKKTNIREILEISGKYYIPIYQRRYSWEEYQCKALWENLMGLMNNPEEIENHFFGSIVSSKINPNAKTIIDGQQRMTTFSLLLAALESVAREEMAGYPEGTGNEGLENIIGDYSKCLRRYSSEVKGTIPKIRLKKSDIPQESDEFIYDSIINRKDLGAPDGKKNNIISNFLWFKGEVNKELENKDEGKKYAWFRDFFEKVLPNCLIIHIELGKEDDAQLIFESLNSTGLGLDEGDKIRNFMLMDLNVDDKGRNKQEDFYKYYWQDIEKLTTVSGKKSLDKFIHRYLLAQEGSSSKVYFSDIYGAFKKYSRNRDKEGLFKEMAEYARYFCVINNPSYPLAKNDEKDRLDKDLQESLRRLNMLKFEVTYPFLMKVLYHRQHAGDEDVAGFRGRSGNAIDRMLNEIMLALQSFLFRRSIMRLSSKNYNEFFASVDSDILRDLENGKYGNYKEALLSRLWKFKDGIPLDDGFKEALTTCDVYKGLQKHIKNYLFECLENRNRSEGVDIVNGYTVEHIMPQEPKEWQKELGGEWDQEFYEKWLHSLPNLTLVTKTDQGRLSNSPLSKKHEIYKNSRIHLTKEILNCRSSLDWIKHGGLMDYKKWLEEQISGIVEWQVPENTDPARGNVSLGREYHFDELDDAVDVSMPESWKLSVGSFNSPVHKVDSWDELYKGVVSALYDIRKLDFSDLIDNEDFIYIKDSEQADEDGFDREEGYLIRKEDTPDDFIKALSGFFNALSLNMPDENDNNDLIITFSNKSSSVEDKPVAPAGKKSRKPRFSFEMLGIPAGGILHFKDDDSITAKVVDGRNTVEYDGRLTTVSKSAQEILKTGSPVQGTVYWMYRGRLLDDIRQEKEKEMQV